MENKTGLQLTEIQWSLLDTIWFNMSHEDLGRFLSRLIKAKDKTALLVSTQKKMREVA